MNNKFYAVVIGMLLCCIYMLGCQVKITSHYKVSVSPLFNAHQLDMIGQAMDQWETVGQQYNQDITFDYTLSDSCKESKDINSGHIICIYYSNDAQVVSLAKVSSVVAFTSYNKTFDSAEVYMAADKLADYSDALFIQTMAHELGHAMGLHHSVAANESPYNAMENAAAEWAPINETALAAIGTPYSVMCAGAWCATQSVQCQDIQQFVSLRGGFETTCP